MAANLVATAAVPAYNCPTGTRMHLLNLGTLRVDEAWILQGNNTSTQSNPNPVNKQRDLILLAGLIYHPDIGLILFETGCAEDLQIAWGAPATDLFPRIEYTDDMKLPAAIKAAGYDIKDVKAVIIGHLHLDHAGGLEHFMGTDTPIHVHEEEFKHACWAAATGADAAVYLTNYMNLEKLKWTTFSEDQYEFAQGITMHHAPGHTPGLCSMQVNLEKDGVFIWTTDQYHVKEHHDYDQPQGWLSRDHNAWVKSSKMLKRLERLFKATLIYGHDKEVAEKLIKAKKYYE